jgi:phage tail tape-measure protein
MGDIAASAILEKEVDEASPGDMEEGELGTAVGAGLGGAVGGIGGAALGGLAGHYLTKDKEVKKESDDLDRMSSLAGIKKKVADESLLAPLVGAVGGAALGGELASGIGSKFGSEVGGSIGQAAGQEQAGKLGALVGGMKGSSAGAVAGGAAAKTAGQVAGGIAGLAGGAAIDQAKKSNDDDETNEGSNKKSSDSALPVVAAGAAGAGLGYMASKMGKTPTILPTPAEIASGTNPMGDIAGSIFEKDNEETDEGWKGQLAGGTAGSIAGGLAGAASPIPFGAAIGSALGGTAGQMIGNKLGGEETDEDDASLFDDATCNMSEAGESCPVHGVEECWGSDDASPLAGQYGHSGKMKAVDKDLSFLDRLKELSGMKK